MVSGEIFRRVIFLGTITAVITVFLYFERLSSQPCSFLTAQYTQALAAGQASLKIKPDPRLLALPDPYDPNGNQGVRLLDAALYHQRYYLYNGITPFITVLVPWLLLTGQQISESHAITGYGLGAVICLAIILWNASRRYFPRAGPVALAMALLAVSLSTAGLLLIRSSHIFDLVLAAAWFHDTAALLAAYLFLHDPARRLRWLALAGLSAGLAVGARPSHLGVAIVIALFILCQVRQMPGTRAILLRRLALVLAPIVAIALALAWFNWIRFGSPLEFGYRYLLIEAAHFSSDFAGPRYIFINLWYYLLGFPRWSGWFPFFEIPGQAPLPVPSGYVLPLELYGLIVTSPFVFCGLAIIIRRCSLPKPLRSFLYLPLWFGLLNLAFLLVMRGAAYRYSADFLPHFGLVGAFGLLVLAENARSQPSYRWPYWSGNLLALFSVLSSFCLTCAFFDFMRVRAPAEFAHIARVFNQPRLWWEQWRRIPLSQFQVTTLLPQTHYGASEPILVTGRESSQNFIYACYTAPGYLQVGFEALGHGGPVSDLIPIDYSQPVVFELGLGPEWPPSGSYHYAGLPATQVETLRRSLIVRVNGKTALDCWVDYHFTKSLYFWGRSPYDTAFGSVFSGTKFVVEKIPMDETSRLQSDWAKNYGALNLELSRKAQVPGTREPIIGMGYRNGGQLLSLKQEEGDHVRFVVSSPGRTADIISASVQIPAQTIHHLRFLSGNLLPPEESHLWGKQPLIDRRAKRREVRLVLDGAVILEGTAEPWDLGPGAVQLGHNSIGFPGVTPDFSGQIKLLGRGSVDQAGN